MTLGPSVLPNVSPSIQTKGKTESNGEEFCLKLMEVFCLCVKNIIALLSNISKTFTGRKKLYMSCHVRRNVGFVFVK